MAKNRNGNRAILVSYPEYRERYLVIDGQIYINIAADPESRIIGRFLRSAENGVSRRR